LVYRKRLLAGSQNIILSCGSGANITILPGDTKVVYSDGAGAGAAFIDAFASLSVVDLIVGGDIDLEGSIDVNGTANLDVVDIDGAVNMATTALVTGVLTTTATQVATGGITSGSDIISDTDSTDSLGSTGVRWLKGWFDSLTAGTLTVGSGSVTDSSGAISFGDENLTTTGIVTAAGTSVFTNLDISGDVDVDGTTNLDVVDIDGAVDMATTLLVTGIVTAATSAKITQVAITSSSNAVAWDAAAAANAYHVTTENTTFSAPSNAVEGAIISVELAQGGTPRTIAWNTVFEFAASTAPTVTATASKTDIFSFRYNGSVWQEIGRVQNLAQT
jgi:hypothetical protein